ncbi:hypothetical protein JCM10213_006425 [Rhodosporidiobolus nylandii]
MLLRTTTSYILSPAYYCSSLCWGALGYSSASSSDRLLTSLSYARLQAARTLDPPKDESGEEEQQARTLRRKDEERVEKALREAMREAEEAAEEAEEVEEDQPGLAAVESEPQAEEASPAFSSSSPAAPLALPPLPDSPDHDLLTPRTSFSSPRLSPRTPRIRPLSSLTRLSRRSTVCLSTLSLYSLAASLQDADAENESGNTLEVLAVEAFAGVEGQPGELEREMVERVLGAEIEEMEREVVGAVEEALELEKELEAEPLRVEEEEVEEAKPEQDPPSEVARREEGSWVSLSAPTDSVRDTGEDKLEGQTATWFSSQKGQAFRNIPVSAAGHGTEPFLQAVESVISLLELLAPAAASLCSAEIQADVNRVRSRLHSRSFTSATIEQLVLDERKERRRPATDSLVWLVRCAIFGASSFKANLDSPTREELSVSFTRIWDEDFSRHVNWLIRPLFKVIVRACPPRATLYSRLATDGATLEDAEREMRVWAEEVEGVVKPVEEWMKREKIVK